MRYRYPEYYEEFQCIAGRCEDTCCAGWEIDIDDESYEYYMQVPGEFGNRIRENIKEYQSGEEDVYERHGFILQEGKRCPFLNKDHLCDMILEIGEDAICYVCTHTPRNYFEYNKTREMSLSPSCPEAGRLIFGRKDPVRFVEKESSEPFGFEETKEEILLARAVEKARDAAIFLLQKREVRGEYLPVTVRLCLLLEFSADIQERLNKGEIEEAASASEDILSGKSGIVHEAGTGILLPDVKKCTAEKYYQMFLKRLKIFTELDSINEDWEHILERIRLLFLEPDSEKRYFEAAEEFHTYIREKKKGYLYEQLLVYYAFLLFPRAVDDENFWGKAQILTVSFLMVRDMNLESFYRNMQEFYREDFMRNVRIYAKEVEHSEENLEVLEEEFLFEDNYSKENLIAQIMFEIPFILLNQYNGNNEEDI